MKITETILSASHRNYRIEGLALITAAHVPRSRRRVTEFTLTGVDGIVLTAPWTGSIESAVAFFELYHPKYKLLLGRVVKGTAGTHDWCIGDPCEDGYLVYVDDRPVTYRDTLCAAQLFAFDLIERLQADGDYRLNEQPNGFNPPLTPRAPMRFSYAPWRHGGWYVHNVRYPNRGCGCVSNNYADKRWRIVCDDRRDQLGQPGDFTFRSRDEAAMAEFWLANAPTALATPLGSNSAAA